MEGAAAEQGRAGGDAWAAARPRAVEMENGTGEGSCGLHGGVMGQDGGRPRMAVSGVSVAAAGGTG